MSNHPNKANQGLCVSELCLGNSMPIVCVCQQTGEPHVKRADRKFLRGKIKPFAKHVLTILQHVSLRGCL